MCVEGTHDSWTSGHRPIPTKGHGTGRARGRLPVKYRVALPQAFKPCTCTRPASGVSPIALAPATAISSTRYTPLALCLLLPCTLSLICVLSSKFRQTKGQCSEGEWGMGRMGRVKEAFLYVCSNTPSMPVQLNSILLLLPRIGRGDSQAGGG